MDKVASSPSLAMAEGWPVQELSLSDNEVAALNVAMGVGMGVSVISPEEQPERHSVADLPCLLPPSPHPTAGTVPSVDLKSSVRLQPVLEDESASAVSSDSDEPGQLFASKVASFYIGGDDGFSPREEKAPSQSTAAAPWKVPVTDETVIEFTPPDGGYGWVVALAACFINLWIVGFIKSYGVLYVEIRNTFPEASAYHTSWLPSLLSTVGLLTAPMTGILCRRFTSRKVTFFGGALCSLGLLLGSLAETMNQLIFCVGLLTGLGAGLTTTSGILIVSLYFETRRAFASAICLSGNALGGFFMPPLLGHLLKTYGLRGAFLILSGLQLHICAASMLFRPISHHAIVQATEKKMNAQKKEKSGDENTDKLIPSSTMTPIRHEALHAPPSHSSALWRKIVQRYLKAENVKQSELHHQVSFLRSTSMMNSIPNLTHYARSWSVTGGQSPQGSRPSVHTSTGADSKSSLSNSKRSLPKLPLFAERPSVLRFSSEDESTGRVTPVQAQHCSSCQSSQSRVASVDLRRPSLTRQTSIRTVQSRIMESVLEQDKEEGDDITQEASQNCMKKNDIATIEGGEREVEEKTDVRGCSCCVECLRGLCDTSLFRDGLFWVVAISVFLVACGTPFSLFYLPSYAEAIDIPTSSATSILSVSSILDLIGRLGTGFVSDLGFFQLHHIYFASSVTAGVAVLLLPHMTSVAGLTVVLSMFGISVGSWFVMIPTMLAVHHGAEHLAASYGLIRLFNGIMNFISPQLTGMLLDLTHSYLVVFTFMGTSMVTGAVLVLLGSTVLLRCRRNCSANKDNSKNNKNKYHSDCNTITAAYNDDFTSERNNNNN